MKRVSSHPSAPARPPHPATVVQRRAAPPQPSARSPHSATIAQRRAESFGPPARPPHPATVTQPRRGVLQRMETQTNAPTSPSHHTTQGSTTKRTKVLGDVAFTYEFEPDPRSSHADVIPSGKNVVFQPGLMLAAAQTAVVTCFPDEAAKGWRLGYLQTVINSLRVFTYEDGKHRQKVKMTITAPKRDGLDESMWFSYPEPGDDDRVRHAVSEPTRGSFVREWKSEAHALAVPEFMDFPLIKIPFIHEQRQLVKVVGFDNFMMWFAARCEKTGQLVLLESHEWHMSFVHLWKEDRFVTLEAAGAFDGLNSVDPIAQPVLDGTPANESFVVSYGEVTPK